ncbi:OLC1v1029868C1 [Oldenlandia corymbosa var. corymbosa]|uniref:OLC1v1029868C1 n=1 Tax=Oldenlandia corymbosa var. corymbosa TaxID=529605 RepID=A0AAV1CFG6_OLDCO|nr:OLC1v1029868C1 [Oldenlandia corymbosa var. corymbosa]
MAYDDRFDLLEDITSSRIKSNWRVNVRVLQTWKPTYAKSKDVVCLEALLVDAKGTKILAQVSKQWIKRFEDQLKEGTVKLLSNFNIVKVGGGYRTNTHQ